MPNTKVVEKKVSPTKEKKRQRPPSIRSRQRGMYNTMMDSCEAAFKLNNPDRSIYWVADPEHDKKFSQVSKRQMMGYELVDAQNEDIKKVMGEIGSTVRIGDVVMMSIPTEWRDEIIAEKNELARSESRRSADAYRRDMERDMDADVARPTGSITDHNEDISLDKDKT